MSNSDPTKEAKRVGRLLKDEREAQGHNVAILAGKCGLSVVQITAIERGDSFPFTKVDSTLKQATSIYAKELGIDIPAAPCEDDDIYIPEFLRKRE